MARVALCLHGVRQLGEIIQDRLHPRRRRIGAIEPLLARGVQVQRVGLRIGIVDAAGRRRRRVALAVTEKYLIGKAKRHAVGPRSTHDRLMIIVAHGVIVGEKFQERHIAFLHVEEGHGLAGIVRRAAGRGRVGRGDRRLQVVQAAGRVAPRGMFLVDRAIHLLVHLEELMDGVGGIGIIGHGRPGHLEWPGGQRVDVGDAGIRTQGGSKTRAPGPEQELVGGGQAGVAARHAEDSSKRRIGRHAADVGCGERCV